MNGHVKYDRIGTVQQRRNRVREKKSELEFQTMFHMMFVTVISILGILLMMMISLSGWKHWQIWCPVIAAAILICWAVHFFQVGSASARVRFYTILVLCGVLYYGGNAVALTDVPIVICLFIILLSIGQDMKLIYLITCAYPVLLVWHIWGTGYIGAGMDMLIFARIALGVICLVCAVFISRFFGRQQRWEREKRERLEKELDDVKIGSERLLVNVSHELRTPINAVNGMSEIILQRELEKGLREEVEAIQNAGRRLYRQVSDILDYSELVTDMIVVSPEDYEPISVINDAISDMQWQQIKKKLDVVIDIQTDMPRLLHGDDGKLKKIIHILLDNAVKFTESGGVYLYVGKRDEDYGINLNIDIWDTGTGMNEEQLKKLFIHFYKEDSDIERKTGGLGLGLAIAHGMIAAMGGFISIQSREENGTHIHVSIPQQVVDDKHSICVKKSSEFQIAYYFNKEKYVRGEIGDYYGRLISHIQSSFNFHVYQAESLEELKKLVEQNPITHVMAAEWEYGMDPKYFDELSKKIFTIIVADQSFVLSESSSAYVLYKPVYLMSVINLLNATVPGTFQEYTRRNGEKKLHFENVKALVVDDDHMNLMVAKGVLKTYGIEADTCLSGELAIERCSFADYQIIFMDYMMPGMNGIDAMQKIRSLRNGHYKQIPVIALTANAVSGAREMFLGEGFDEFVSKPIELTTITRVLRKMLTGGKSDDE